LILFDINVPDFNGFEVGTDDYIKKTFDFDKLIVRVKVLLRKSFQSADNKVKYKDLFYSR